MPRALAYVDAMPPAAERTDSQVVRDVLAGDRDAYRLLVRRYGDVLYGHALRMAGNASVTSTSVGGVDPKRRQARSALA